jgi:hypothetical protein
LLYFSFFLLITLEGTIASFFKDKKSLRSHKTEERKFFLTILLDEERIRILPLTNESGPDPGGPQTYGSGFGTLVSYILFIVYSAVSSADSL